MSNNGDYNTTALKVAIGMGVLIAGMCVCWIIMFSKYCLGMYG